MSVNMREMRKTRQQPGVSVFNCMPFVLSVVVFVCHWPFHRYPVLIVLSGVFNGWSTCHDPLGAATNIYRLS